MRTVTLPYSNNANADNALYSKSGLSPLPEQKEYYTPEELREILLSDLQEIYGMQDAV